MQGDKIKGDHDARASPLIVSGAPLRDASRCTASATRAIEPRKSITPLARTAVWQLATAVLLTTLLTGKAEARTWICWWEYPGPICAIVKPLKPTTRLQWTGISHRKRPRCPRGFWAVCGECPC